MIPMNISQEKLICNNVVKTVLTKDITCLTKQAYNFLYLCNGFIAHYDLHGFICYYRERSLKEDLFKNLLSNQWANFREGESEYEYYMQKKRMYNSICKRIDGNKTERILNDNQISG